MSRLSSHIHPTFAYEAVSLNTFGTMSLGSSNSDNDLQRSGIVAVGKIDLKLIIALQARLEPKSVARRIHRQTQLNWNSECDAVVAFFEAVS